MGALNGFDVGVHATDTGTAFLDGEADESTITPAGAPGVLDFPVVVVAIDVGALEHAGTGLVGACVPPLGDVASKLGCGGVDTTITTLTIRVADNDDGMIELGTAVVSHLDDARFVVLEGGLASIKSDGDGLCLDNGLHCVDISDSSVATGVAYDLAWVVSALGLSSGGS